MTDPEGWSTRTLVKGDRVSIVLAGEIDFAACGAVTDALLTALDVHRMPVVLDLGEVTFIDSSGVRALLVAHRRSLERDRPIVVGATSHQARRIIELSGLAAMFDLGRDDPGDETANV
jgi:anti-sigma B factor antagonist